MRTLYPLNIDELHSITEVKKRERLDTLIERRRGTSKTPSNVLPSCKCIRTALPDTQSVDQDSDKFPRLIPKIEDAVDSTGRLIGQ